MPPKKITPTFFKPKQVNNAAKDPFRELCNSKDIFINQVLALVNSKNHTGFRTTIKQELENIFNYTIEYCNAQQNENPLFFLSVFSDILWVEEESIRDIFNKIQVTLPEKKGTAISLPLEEPSPNDKTCPVELSDIKANLPHYWVSSEFFKHRLFDNDSVSCYPQELFAKVDIYNRFLIKYSLPEKTNKYARPILDIELSPSNRIACVRCYLTLADRPRNGSNDKDITQDNDGNIIFSNVQLMNFSDPLRALTWAEDYTKNVEHSKGNKPIIRSCLIPLITYNNLILSVVPVDVERAPGQVKTLDSNLLNPIRSSLVSFTNHTSTTYADGIIKKLEELSDYLLGHKIHPKNIAESPYIAHQYGRFISSKQEKTYWARSPEFMILARQLERELSGFALNPNNNPEQMNITPTI